MPPSDPLWKKLLSDFYLFVAIILVLACIKVITLFMHYSLMIENDWEFHEVVGCSCFVIVIVLVGCIELIRAKRKRKK